MIEAGWSSRLPPEPYVALVDTLYQAGAEVRRARLGRARPRLCGRRPQRRLCELHMNSWDALAGLLLVEEAGGWTNDFLAGDVRYARATRCSAAPRR